jgi:hypothetical protein
MSLQVVVIAHGNGIAAFKRHEKYWLAHRAPVLVLCPEDDPIDCQDCLAVGKATRAGMDSIYRLNALFRSLDCRSWERCVIYEYDSFSLDGKLPEGRGFWGNIKPNMESPKMMAARYANPPWCFDRESFDAMNEVRKQFDLYEEGEADRWLSAHAELAGIPILNYSPNGFSRGTISQQKKDINKLRVAIYQGATMIHGIKQEWVLRAAEQFYDERDLPGSKEIAAMGKVR